MRGLNKKERRDLLELINTEETNIAQEIPQLNVVRGWDSIQGKCLFLLVYNHCVEKIWS